MILTCPRCAARFMLSAQMLAPEGRRVRCSACREQWFQFPDPDELLANLERQMEEIPDETPPIPKGSGLPVLSEEKNAFAMDPRKAALLGYGASALVGVVVLTGLIWMKAPILRAWLPSAPLYETLGLSVEGYGEGLVFDQVRANVSDAGDSVVIEGHIINLTGMMQNVPLIQAVLKDKEGQPQGTWYIQLPESVLPSEGNMPFTAEYHGPVKKAEKVDLHFVLTAEAKTASEGGDSTPVPPAEGSDHSHGGESPPQSHVPASSHSPQEPSHGDHPDAAHSDAPEDHAAPPETAHH